MPRRGYTAPAGVWTVYDYIIIGAGAAGCVLAGEVTRFRPGGPDPGPPRAAVIEADRAARWLLERCRLV
jgi:hypothetical protein